MNLKEAIQARRSIRAFQSKEVEPEKLAAILEAIQQAPSAGNLQAYQIYLIRDAKTKEALAASALRQAFLAQAPVVLVFCADRARASQRYGQRGESLYCVQDATIAVAYAQLAATVQGLATCWIGAFDEEPISRIVGVSQEQRPIAMLPLGYAAETPQPTSRRSLAELVVEKYL